MDDLSVALLYAKTAPEVDEWVEELHESYDIDILHEKFRSRLLNGKALALLKTPKE